MRIVRESCPSSAGLHFYVNCPVFFFFFFFVFFSSSSSSSYLKKTIRILEQLVGWFVVWGLTAL